MVQMSLRLFEKIPKEIGPSPNVVVVKNYVLSDKPLTISAKLDKGNYTQGEEIQLTLKFHRKDKQPHGIRKVKVTLFQQVSFLSNYLRILIEISKVFCKHPLMPKDKFDISHQTRCYQNTLEYLSKKALDHGIFLEFLKGSDKNYILSDKPLTISVKLYKARKYSWSWNFTEKINSLLEKSKVNLFQQINKKLVTLLV